MNTLLSGELLKLRTVRTPWLVLLAAQAALVLGVTGLVVNNDTSDPDLPAQAVSHVGLVSLFMLVLGATAVAGEYRHRTIATTYLATPRRTPVVLAKLLVYTGLGLASGIVSAAIALAATAVAYGVTGDSLSLSDGDLWTTLVGGVAWNAAFAAIGVGLGAVVRSLPVAVGAALAWLALVEGLVAQLIGDAGDWLPFAAGRALGALPETDGLAQGTAAVVLLGYGVAFAVAGAAVTTRTDVT